MITGLSSLTYQVKVRAIYRGHERGGYVTAVGTVRGEDKAQAEAPKPPLAEALTPPPAEEPNHPPAEAPKPPLAEELNSPLTEELEPPLAKEPKSPPKKENKAIIGLVGGSGWGPVLAKKVIAAGFVSERLEAGSPWTTLKESYENGFRNDQVIVGNTPDETKLSEINIASWVATALGEVKEADSYGYTLLEVGNEMYSKGGQAEPVKYAKMYTALSEAVEHAGIDGVTLIFDSFGDYKTTSGEESNLAGGRGWLGDALKAEPVLKGLVGAFSSHPYGVPGVKYYGHDWGIEGLESQRAAAVSLGFAHTDYYATEYGEEDHLPQNEADAALQAERIKWAYNEMLTQPYIKGIWYYQLHDDGTGKWGLVSAPWKPRPAMAVLAGFLR
jgi:hypothetical protein